MPSCAGVPEAVRRAYVERLAAAVRARAADERYATVYFGGGTPALCDLAPLWAALRPRLAADVEFTVELHPRDVVPDLLAALAQSGVNRVSLGVQSFDDAVLAALGRGYTGADAQRAFDAIRAAGFENAGIDLIAGLPGVADVSWRDTLERACALAPAHCSVYTLIREPGTRLDLDVRRGKTALPSDDAALAQFDAAVEALSAIGLTRYETSNFARPGLACRHNGAVWRGEDYVGLGSGARGREGLSRTEGGWGEGAAWRPGRLAPDGAWRVAQEELTPAADAWERAAFALRTVEGLDVDAAVRRWPALAAVAPVWKKTLADFAALGLLAERAGRFAPTPRGWEVNDSILAALVV